MSEARRWLPEPTPAPFERVAGPRIRVAEDNVDMRDYLRRLLSGRWQVETVPDGLAAENTAPGGRIAVAARRPRPVGARRRHRDLAIVRSLVAMHGARSRPAARAGATAASS